MFIRLATGLLFHFLSFCLHCLFREYSLTSLREVSLYGLDSVALLGKNDQKMYFLGRIQMGKTGGQPYSDTSLQNVSEYSL